MDPATIAGLCLAIARNAVAFINGINDIRSNYREAGLNVRNIRRQTDLLILAAGRVQAWMNRPGARLTEEEQRIFNDSVQACRMYVETLRRAVDETLRVGENGKERITRWSRIRFLWEQARLDRYLVTVNNQVTVFNFLLQTLNLPGEEARRERLRSATGTSIINEALSSASSTSSEISTASRSIFSGSDDQSNSGSRSTKQSTGPKSTARNFTTFSNSSSWNLSLESLRPEDSASNIGFTMRANVRGSNLQVGLPSMGQRPRPTQDQGPSAQKIPNSNEQKDGNASEADSDRTETGRGRRMPAVEDRSRQSQRTRRRRVNIDAQNMKRKEDRNIRHKTANGGDGNGSSSSSEDSISPEKPDKFTAPDPLPDRAKPYGTRRFNDEESESGSSAIASFKEVQDSLLEFQINDDEGSVISAASSFSGVQDSLDGIRSRLSNPNHVLNEADGQEILLLMQNLQQLMGLLQTVLRNNPNVGARDLAHVRDALARAMAEAEGLLMAHFPRMAPQPRQGTTIHDAVRQMDADSITRILGMGINPDLLDDDGNTPLSLVSLTEPAEKVIEVYQALLDGHANPNVPCRSGQTPLYLAAKKSELYAMEILIEHNARVNLRHRQLSKTPLHLICRSSSQWKCQALKLLLSRGADLEAISSNGSRALDFALESVQKIEHTIFADHDVKPSTIWYYCMVLREDIGAIALLLERQQGINLTMPSRRILRMRYYTLQGMERLAGMSIQDARVLAQERKVEVLLQDDVELHTAVRRFHQARMPN